MNPILLIIIISVSFGFLLGLLSTPKSKGIIGEWQISNLLKGIAKKGNGYVINDVIIPNEDGTKTSQIDHILFVHSGIYVIETKNYSGRIYGSVNQREWTQVLNHGKVKNKLYNPIMQNGTHVSRLSSLLNQKYGIKSCVVFKQGNINHIDAPVYGYYSLKRYLTKSLKENVFDNNTLLTYYNKIKEFKTNPISSNRKHVKEIKTMMKKIEKNICPRCGSPLVLRHGEYGDFYGCSNYPKCKFIKK